jgi:hypothetical protein
MFGRASALLARTQGTLANESHNCWNGTDSTFPLLNSRRTWKLGHAQLLLGRSQQLTTEVSTLPERCKELVFQQLPVLFQDAIAITRRFGYTYLWIDCICIIQDSRDDWQIESANMGHIYKNSSLTIAGEASPNCTVGIFESTNEGRSSPQPGSKSAAIGLVRKLPKHHYSARDGIL